MQNVVRLLLVMFCVAGSVSACEAGPQSRAGSEARTRYDLCVRGVARTSQGVLRVCDQLNATTVAEIRHHLSATDTEIILTSGGGTSTAAMELGRLLRDRGVTVRARQFCLSACSTYVLMAAKKVVVDPYTMVAFHHTGAFVIDLLADRAGAPEASPSRQLARDERAYFEEIGLSPDLPMRLAEAVEPTCVGYGATEQGRVGIINYRYNWFIPTPAEASTLFGERLSGYWPQSRAEATAILRATLGEPGLTIRFGWPTGQTTPTAVLARTLPACERSGAAG